MSRSSLLHDLRGGTPVWWNARNLVYVLGLTAAILAGCVTSNSQVELREINAGRSAIRFEHHDFHQDLSTYALQEDVRTGNEWHVATFNGPDSMAVLAALITSAGYVAEERRAEAVVPDLVAPMAESSQIVWGDTGGANSSLGYTRYRFFRIAEQSLGCAGFSQTVGESHDDRARKHNIIYGYFCRDESRPMTPEAAEELIASVRLSR